MWTSRSTLARVFVLFLLSFSASTLFARTDPAVDPAAQARAARFARSEAALAKERAIGEQAAAQVDRQMRFYDEFGVVLYLDQLTRRLAFCGGAVPYTRIRVVVDPTPNAMSLPGGYLYVNSGLLMTVNSEAELAGVIAHELGHVQLRHGIKQVRRSGLLDLISIPLLAVGGIGAAFFDEYAPIGSAAIERRFERKAELESDKFAQETLSACNYDPNAIRDFMQRVLPKDKSRLPWLATHPARDQRVQKLDAVASSAPTDDTIVSSKEFLDMRERISGMESKLGFESPVRRR